MDGSFHISLIQKYLFFNSNQVDVLSSFPGLDFHPQLYYLLIFYALVV